jgi:hypothetical protein|tara:strand:+ start:2501 stop:3085 length:585 start_codon:yes stop_codon:yes gene_type:complete
MQKQVQILADDMGNVIRQSNNNSEYGYIRLQQSRVSFGTGGWVKKSNLSTLLHGKVEDLQTLGFKANETLAGKIVVKEQLEPFNSNDPDRDYKYAGDTGIVCCVDGQPIYRKTFFTPDTTAQDVMLAHTNGQDIKEANGSVSSTKTNSVSVSAASVEEAFDIKTDVEETEVVEEEVVSEVEDELVEEEAETFEL